MTEKKEKQPTEQETKQAASFLWDLILWVAGSYVLKTSWNVSLRHMFPNIPYMGFGNAVGILTFVYIIARVAALGFMAEVQRTAAMAIEIVNETLKKFPFGIKIKQREEEEGSDQTPIDMN